MKKKFVALALVFIFLLSFLPLNALAEYHGGQDNELQEIWYVNRSRWNYEKTYLHNRAILDNRPTCEDGLNFFRREMPGWMMTLEIGNRSQEIISKAEELTSGLECELEKARAICNWVARNIRQDIHNAYTNPLDVLRYRRAVCDGISNLAVALLRAVNIPAIVVDGGAGPSPPMWHAWVEFFADDRWVIADPTWMRVKNGQFDISIERLSRDRFLDGGLHHGITVDRIIFSEGFIIFNNSIIGEILLDRSNTSYIVIPDEISEIIHFCEAFITRAEEQAVVNNFTYLERLCLPENLVNLSARFFNNSLLSEVSLPDTLEVIGSNVFEGTALTEIYLPMNIRQIGTGAFKNTNLIQVIIPPNVRRIEIDTFANTNLEAVYIHENVNMIGVRAFDNVENLTIFGYYNSVAYHHAYNNDFNFVEVTSTPEFINGFVIYNDSIIGSYGLGSEITIPDSFESIGAFTNSKVEAVYIPPTVTSIDSNAFGSISVIYGKPDSVAQAFAEERGIAFIAAYGLREPMAVPEVVDVHETIIYVSINEEAERNTSTLIVIIVAVAILPLSVVVILIIRKRRND